MPLKIGFAILTHNEPTQLLRLVKTLNAMFGDPPIVCHHDFSQCSLQEELFPANVRFVRPHIVTHWGRITLPLAALKAFSLLREYGQPDWYFLLSGTDYPVRPADEILADLADTNFDAFLDNREILYRALPAGQTAEHGHGSPAWIPVAYSRYCTCRRPRKTILFSRRLLFAGRIAFTPIKNHTVDRFSRFFQFNRPSRIYGGAFWFHANYRSIDHLLDDPSMKRLVRYYRTRFVPDESIFHTALCNQKDLRICKNHKRYEDWTKGGAHPKWLDVSDLQNIVASGAYFARKIRDTQLLELIERSLLRL